MEKLQVLIIDDDRDIAGFFSTVLNLLGHECETVLSAKEALTRLAGSPGSHFAGFAAGN